MTRIQLKRQKGWRMPPNTKVVDRRGKWGNPYPLGSDPTLSRYREYLIAAVESGELDLSELYSYDHLACWCKPGSMCHADILLDLVEASKARDEEGCAS